MSKMVDVAIVGSGPYGLSIAAHLSKTKVNYRIFGSPMETWLDHMPPGMKLKSDGFASNLYDPDSAFTLQHYCAEKNLPYADVGIPVPLRLLSLTDWNSPSDSCLNWNRKTLRPFSASAPALS
jgi:hypothetical protein